jgi:putative flippase GtrA
MRTVPGLQFLRFCLVGVLNTGVGLGTIFAAKAFAGWGDLSANGLGYGLGLMVSFALNRRWTFRDAGGIRRSAYRFLAAFAIAYPLNLLTVFGLRDLVGVDSYLAQVAGTVPYTICFFTVSRYFVFRNPRERAA